MTTDDLLREMRCVMFDGQHQRWMARCTGGKGYEWGKTPRQAMERALAVRDAPKTDMPNQDLF